MQDLYWKCRICEACGVCGRTEEECQIYHEYYEMEETQPHSTIVKQDVQEKKPDFDTRGGIINRLTGKLVNINQGDYAACLTVAVGDKYLSSLLPLHRFKELGKREGDTVTAVFKAVNVKIMM
jgi:molybdopterin-binding protein